MKTAEEVLKPYKRIIYEKDCGNIVCVSSSIDILDCYDAMAIAKTESWNEAIESVLKLRTVPSIPKGHTAILYEDILKLKK